MHLTPSIGAFVTPDADFDHVHINIIGPLAASHGYTYLLICIDRFTRWPETILTSIVTAELVTGHFIERRMALYECPSNITTDRKQQFVSDLPSSITDVLGRERTRMTVSRPASSGLVERFRCQRKRLSNLTGTSTDAKRCHSFTRYKIMLTDRYLMFQGRTCVRHDNTAV